MITITVLPDCHVLTGIMCYFHDVMNISLFKLSCLAIKFDVSQLHVHCVHNTYFHYTNNLAEHQKNLLFILYSRNE